MILYISTVVSGDPGASYYQFPPMSIGELRYGEGGKLIQIIQNFFNSWKIPEISPARKYVTP